MTDHVHLRFGSTEVSLGEAWSFVTLAHGSTVPAAPHDDEQYRATARRLGYGEDTAAMCRHHDALHALLSYVLGLPSSPVLSTVGGCPSGDPVLHGLEEEMVMAFTKFANAAGTDLTAVLKRWGSVYKD